MRSYSRYMKTATAQEFVIHVTSLAKAKNAFASNWLSCIKQARDKTDRPGMHEKFSTRPRSKYPESWSIGAVCFNISERCIVSIDQYTIVKHQRKIRKILLRPACRSREALGILRQDNCDAYSIGEFVGWALWQGESVHNPVQLQKKDSQGMTFVRGWAGHNEREFMTRLVNLSLAIEIIKSAPELLKSPIVLIHEKYAFYTSTFIISSWA